MCCNQYEVFDLIIKLIGFPVTAGSFFATALQFRKSNKWKRKEFANNSIVRFFDDPYVRNTMLMLDWQSRIIVHTEEHAIMTGSKTFTYSENMLESALKIGANFSPQEVAIRDCFDVFFAGIQQFNDLVRSGVMEYSDFQPYFQYWGDLLRGRIAHKSEASLEAIKAYVVHYFDRNAVDAFLNSTSSEMTRTA